jgi:glycosyltransferase involved in cell wall biosynthesis
MARIVYLSFPTGAISGGQKVILRHVEALNRLGFDAVWWRNKDAPSPTWLDFDVRQAVGTAFRPDDILVLPSDAPGAIRTVAARTNRTVVFEQNQFTFVHLVLEQLDAFPADRFPAFIAVGETNANTIRRACPGARVEIVPCFADERIFKPGPAPAAARVAYVPRKRPAEAKIIRAFLQRTHARHAGLDWAEISNLPERDTAERLAGSSLFLSLARFESVGMTALEAMASGCVCAGFTGIGGRQFATSDNGFWVPEDDCEAASDALAQAADLVATGGADLARMKAAARATAADWSYARFLAALEATWERLAPEARTLGAGARDPSTHVHD